MWHTCQLIMIVSLDIMNNNQNRCHSLGFCNVTGTFIYFKTITLAIATTLVVNVRVPFNFTTWNKVVYTSGYVITYIIKTTEPNHLILILNLANKSYFIIKVNFCHLLAWFKNYGPLKVGVNSFWDTLYIKNLPQGVCGWTLSSQMTPCTKGIFVTLLPKEVVIPPLPWFSIFAIKYPIIMILVKKDRRGPHLQKRTSSPSFNVTTMF